MELYMVFLIGVIIGAVIISVFFLLTLKKKNNSISELVIAKTRVQTQYDLLQESIKESESRAESQLKNQMDALKMAFAEAADKLFDEKTRKLNETNEKDIKTILDPLKEKMEAFKKEVQESKEKSIQNTASLQEQINNMLEKAKALGEETNNLATVLKGKNKIQGNLGEIHLENQLKAAGFKENVDYLKQWTVKDEGKTAIRNDETDKKLVPDIVIIFPDNKAVVVDSKVSITSYIDYCQADTDKGREEAEKRHIDSVRSHIKELSRKEYSSALRKTNKNSLKYVIMYIPYEGAFQLFFSAYQQEWQDAFDKGVIVIGDLYLITMLNIIKLTWDENLRQKNTEKITLAATEVMDRVADFITLFEAIGKQINQTQSSFENARKKLFGSRSSLLTASKSLQNLGIECKKPLPSGLLIEDIEKENTES